jgi:hypothetical protein
MASKHELNTVVMFLKNTEQTELLAPHLQRKRFLLCHLVSAESPYYLHVKAPCGEGKKIWGDFLIPHSSVCFVAFGEDKAICGFGR